ncbi:phenylalanine--tRNA ligase subunit alpha [bacterium B13(2017)]|nr:phenylalanine--tRNA ligase subunit alpha [bacterium B13(2017)]
MGNQFLDEVRNLKKLFLKDLKSSTKENYSDLKTKFLGRNGLVSSLMKNLSSVPKEEKPVFGKAINELKQEINNELENYIISNKKHAVDQIKEDHTLPGRNFRRGSFHPITIVLNEISTIFERLGFTIVEGPEIETDYNNFTALNIPLNHPARDMHDTFYFDANRLLRTHTSPVQIRIMQNDSPPFRIIAPGKVYRRDSDITHSPMFHQIEGLFVSQNVNFGHLKSVLSLFAKSIFDASCKVRFRPSFFPFTEPSAEVDISCVICNGKGCRTCSNSGWIEILGAGMVDPQVLENVGIDPEKYTGYAFGMGVERIAMLKFGIKDIRLFFENHLDFINQFYNV